MKMQDNFLRCGLYMLLFPKKKPNFLQPPHALKPPLAHWRREIYNDLDRRIDRIQKNRTNKLTNYPPITVPLNGLSSNTKRRFSRFLPFTIATFIPSFSCYFSNR